MCFGSRGHHRRLDREGNSVGLEQSIEESIDIVGAHISLPGFWVSYVEVGHVGNGYRWFLLTDFFIEVETLDTNTDSSGSNLDWLRSLPVNNEAMRHWHVTTRVSNS